MLRRRATEWVSRIVSFQANTSARDPSELEGSDELLTEKSVTLAHLMVKEQKDLGVQFLGGCCGTDTSHIAELGRNI